MKKLSLRLNYYEEEELVAEEDPALRYSLTGARPCSWKRTKCLGLANL